MKPGGRLPSPAEGSRPPLFLSIRKNEETRKESLNGNFNDHYAGTFSNRAFSVNLDLIDSLTR